MGVAMSGWEVVAVFVGGPAAITVLIIALVVGFTRSTGERPFPILRPHGVDEASPDGADPVPQDAEASAEAAAAPPQSNQPVINPDTAEGGTSDDRVP